MKHISDGTDRLAISVSCGASSMTDQYQYSYGGASLVRRGPGARVCWPLYESRNGTILLIAG